MQGFLVGRPVPPEQLADLLRPAPLLVSPPLQPAAEGAAAASASRPLQRRTAV
jgi:hypothetical protein